MFGISHDYFEPADHYVVPEEAARYVGRRARMLRIEAEIGAMEFARRAKMQPARVRTFENGTYAAHLPLLQRIARTLGVDVLDLLWDLRFDPPKGRFARNRPALTDSRHLKRTQVAEASTPIRSTRAAQPTRGRNTGQTGDPQAETEAGDPRATRLCVRANHAKRR